MTWAFIAVDNPMGQQRYEFEIQSAMRRVADGDQWAFRPMALRSLRSTQTGDRRYPAGLSVKGPVWATSAIGAVLYPRGQLVHRFDLRLPPARGREVLTVLDLAPLRFLDEGEVPVSAMESARRAHAVICPSRFSALELHELFGIENASVIHCGVSSSFLNPTPLARSEIEKLGLTPQYVLHAGGATARKNLSALAGAWREIESRIPEVSLVLCGPPDARRTELFEKLPRVKLLGRVQSSLLVGLMAGAVAVVVPSLYEGFGLPALEGMACGVPVLAARAGSLPEICGTAAELVEPSVSGLAAGLELVVTDSEVSGRLRRDGPVRAREFSWDNAAKEHLQVYEALLSV